MEMVEGRMPTQLVVWEHPMEMRMPAQGTPECPMRCDEAEQIGSSVPESSGVFVEMFVDGAVY